MNTTKTLQIIPNSVSNIFSSLKYELAAYATTIRNIKIYWVDHHSSGLWYPGDLCPLDYQYNQKMILEGISRFVKEGIPFLEPYLEAYDRLNLFPGRLTCILSGAGKRRILAIGNYVRQRLLHPVHSWAMQVLSRLPCDVQTRRSNPSS